MECQTNFSLRALNTFNIEAAAARYVRFDEEQEILDHLNRHYLSGQPYLILGGGSNLLFVADFDGSILHPMLKGIHVLETDRRFVRVKAMAGENWDDLVAHAVANGWGGIENLSLIPGSVGASAVQNIGAYGVEVETVIDRVEAICMQNGQPVTFDPQACGFGYRFSHFKGSWAGRYLITAVVFRFRRQPQFVLTYPGVREAIDRLGPVSLATIRQAIINIREAKLPDPAHIGNAGSFFKNPVVKAADLNRLLKRFSDMPHYPQGGESFKLPAGWMIERCGWKGRHIGRAAVHDRQALVLVNLGGATGREILELSEKVQHAVLDTFGIALEREVMVIR